MFNWHEHRAAHNHHNSLVSGSFNDLAQEMNKLNLSPALTFAREQVARMAVLFDAPVDLQQQLLCAPTHRTLGDYSLVTVNGAFYKLGQLALTTGQYCFPISEDNKRSMFFKAAQEAQIYLTHAMRASDQMDTAARQRAMPT